MIRFEIKKILKNKFLISAFTLFLLMNFYNISQLNKNENVNTPEYEEGYERIYSLSKGKISENKQKFIADNYKKLSKIIEEGDYSVEPGQNGTYTGYVFGDMSVFQEFYDRMKYAINYQKFSQKIESKAKENVDFFGDKNNSYEVENNLLIKNLYAGRSINRLYKFDDFMKYLQRDFSVLLTMLLLVVGILPLYLTERHTFMDHIIYTSSNGIDKIARAKNATSILFIMVTTVLMRLSDLAFCSYFYHLEGWNSPIYCMRFFKYSVFDMKIIQYIVFDIIMRVLAMLLFGFVLVCLSKKMIHMVGAFCVSLIIIVFLIFLSIHSDFIVNPILLSMSGELIKNYEVVKIFGHPVLKAFVIPFANIGIFLFFVFLSSYMPYRIQSKQEGE